LENCNVTKIEDYAFDASFECYILKKHPHARSSKIIDHKGFEWVVGCSSVLNKS
jgi:hypothetical protein